MTSIRRALISVSDKNGIVDFVRKLRAFGVEIISTGGTARLLRENRIPVTEVDEVTGFPEIMDGRVKTLHPKIHGGLLGRRGTDEPVMREHDIEPVDMLVVNLYPFEETIADPECDLANAVENIDIGGPAMLRAAAKNHASVTVVVDNGEYENIITEMQSHNGAVSRNTRFRLAVSAFAHTARYDAAISDFLGYLESGTRGQAFPANYTMQFRKAQDMRYGENPHQRAAFYTEREPGGCHIASARQVQGKELSFNNINDADTALECVKTFSEPACVIVKHANPCGVAQGVHVREAYENAYACDPQSAFGGIIAFNRTLDVVTAREIIERQFVEVIIAPMVEAEARQVLSSKKNVRVLELGDWDPTARHSLDYRRVTGGLLVQDRDIGRVTRDDLNMVSRRWPSDREIGDLLFCWKVVKFVKSNAIVYAAGGATLGIGAGQMSRVDSARIAGWKAADARLPLKGSVMASDAFFPFRDSIDAAAEAGVRAIIQPGGSKRDDEVIRAADEHDIAMVFTNMRHFRH